MGKKGIETLVGAFVLLGILAFAFLALKAANLGSVDRNASYTLTARFSNIGGLKVRAPVKCAGVLVGRVSAITLDRKNYEGVVTLSIDERNRFPKDSAVRILTSGLLGDQYIGIDPGAEEAELAAGDTVSQTQSAVVLENLIGQIMTGKATEGGAK